MKNKSHASSRGPYSVHIMQGKKTGYKFAVYKKMHSSFVVDVVLFASRFRMSHSY